MKLRAFNLIPGCVFILDDHQYVATGALRNADTEVITISTRTATVALDYNHLVELVGISVNPADEDDTDFGTE